MERAFGRSLVCWSEKRKVSAGNWVVKQVTAADMVIMEADGKKAWESRSFIIKKRERVVFDTLSEVHSGCVNKIFYDAIN